MTSVWWIYILTAASHSEYRNHRSRCHTLHALQRYSGAETMGIITIRQNTLEKTTQRQKARTWLTIVFDFHLVNTFIQNKLRWTFLGHITEDQAWVAVFCFRMPIRQTMGVRTQNLLNLDSSATTKLYCSLEQNHAENLTNKDNKHIITITVKPSSSSSLLAYFRLFPNQAHLLDVVFLDWFDRKVGQVDRADRQADS